MVLWRGGGRGGNVRRPNITRLGLSVFNNSFGIKTLQNLIYGQTVTVKQSLLFSSEDVVAFYCLSISERWGVKFAGPAKIIPLNYLPSSNVIHSGAAGWDSGPVAVQAWAFGGGRWEGRSSGGGGSIPMTITSIHVSLPYQNKVDATIIPFLNKLQTPTEPTATKREPFYCCLFVFCIR